MKPDEQENLERGTEALSKVFQSENPDRAEHAEVSAGKTERVLSRRMILDDLARAEYAEGVYDQVPDDSNSGS
jgi:hypothetical protein